MTTQELHDSPRSAWHAARKACKSIEDRTALGKVIAAGWQPEELAEFARICFFRNGKDYPTPRSYRDAIQKIARDLAWKASNSNFEGLSARWRKQYNEHGRQPIPPRDSAKLKRPDGFPIDVENWAWPYHTPAHRAEIDSLARQRFTIEATVPVPPWAWEIARMHWRKAQSAFSAAEARA